jgi:hypothetical protein
MGRCILWVRKYSMDIQILVPLYLNLAANPIELCVCRLSLFLDNEVSYVKQS